ncbi:MAG: amidohydrolase [Actinobacteria bacterium]|nr:amidohydrolase [Actinomycetota bacterium]|tara:strand:+ start:2840 stop:3862 length:1023 start_codon:yes stop_codon:yes gene_type:complete
MEGFVTGLIDVHGHIVLEGSLGAAGPTCGPELGAYEDGTTWFRVGDWRLEGVPYRESLFMQTNLRLEAMDEAGIRVQALSPNPLTYLHWIPAADAINFCRAHNEDLASVISKHPDRFVGFAALPMQDIDAAIAELERSVNDYGLMGGYIGTDFGTDLDDERMDPFYAACVELDVPLFLHPTASGLDGPLRDQRMRKYSLDLVIEFSYEEMIATSMLVFGGVSRRFPKLDICISHGGGSTMMHRAKLRALAERRPSSPEWIREPGAFDTALDRLWFDCHVTGDKEFEFALEQIGTERLVFGTNFGGWDKGTLRHVDGLTEKLNANAVDLLRLKKRSPHLLD